MAVQWGKRSKVVEAEAPSRPEPPWRLFALPEFRRLWTIGLAVFVVRWLETLAIAVFTWQQTHSAFLVAMMTMLRLVPMGLFGVFIGALAERADRRIAMIGITASMLATSLVLAILAHAGQLAVWHLALACLVNGFAWASDNPVRRILIGEAVGPARISTAMSIDIGTNNASRMLGPTLGGLLLGLLGIDGAFMLSVVIYLPALVACCRLRRPPPALGPPPGAVLARIAEGFRVLRQDRRLQGVLVVTIIFNIFGWPCTSLVPVVAQDRLGLGPEATGLVASMDGVGALCGAALMAFLARPAFYRFCYIGGVSLYLLMLVVFASATAVLPAALAMLAVGLGGAGFSIMQATLVYLGAAPEMRSRLLGILSLCIGLGPIGFLGLGLLADAIGAQQAVLASAIAGLLATAAAWPLWRRI